MEQQDKKTNGLLPWHVLHRGTCNHSFGTCLQCVYGCSKLFLILANSRQINFRYS